MRRRVLDEEESEESEELSVGVATGLTLRAALSYGRSYHHPGRSGLSIVRGESQITSPGGGFLGNQDGRHTKWAPALVIWEIGQKGFGIFLGVGITCACIQIFTPPVCAHISGAIILGVALQVDRRLILGSTIDTPGRAPPGRRKHGRRILAAPERN